MGNPPESSLGRRSLRTMMSKAPLFHPIPASTQRSLWNILSIKEVTTRYRTRVMVSQFQKVARREGLALDLQPPLQICTEQMKTARSKHRYEHHGWDEKRLSHKGNKKDHERTDECPQRTQQHVSSSNNSSYPYNHDEQTAQEQPLQ